MILSLCYDILLYLFIINSVIPLTTKIFYDKLGGKSFKGSRFFVGFFRAYMGSLVAGNFPKKTLAQVE